MKTTDSRKPIFGTDDLLELESELLWVREEAKAEGRKLTVRELYQEAQKRLDAKKAKQDQKK